jgi:hypothetical protein
VLVVDIILALLAQVILWTINWTHNSQILLHTSLYISISINILTWYRSNVVGGHGGMAWQTFRQPLICNKQFVKGCPSCRRHRPQWRVFSLLPYSTICRRQHCIGVLEGCYCYPAFFNIRLGTVQNFKLLGSL